MWKSREREWVREKEWKATKTTGNFIIEWHNHITGCKTVRHTQKLFAEPQGLFPHTHIHTQKK